MTIIFESDEKAETKLTLFQEPSYKDRTAEEQPDQRLTICNVVCIFLFHYSYPHSWNLKEEHLDIQYMVQMSRLLSLCSGILFCKFWSIPVLSFYWNDSFLFRYYLML